MAEGVEIQDALRHHVTRLVQHGDAASGPALEGLLRQTKSTAALLAIIKGVAETIGEAPTAPPELLLCCQLLQKTLRRAPAAEIEGSAAVLLPLLRMSASLGCGWSLVLTQLSLAFAVLLIRTEAWDVAQLLPSLATELGGTGADGAMLAVLTVLAEEIHAPAAKISVAPARTAAVRQALRREAGAVLTAVGSFCEQQQVAASAMRCGRAWCSAGLFRIAS